MASPDFNPFGLFSVCYWVFTASSKNPKTLIRVDKEKPPVWLIIDSYR